MIRAASNVRHMNGAHVQQQVADVVDVADALYKRTDEVALLLARAITREVKLYQSTAPVPFQIVVSACTAHIHAIFSAIAADSEFDPTAATEVGVERARDGVPLASVMEAYRVAFHRVWEVVVEEADIRVHGRGEALRALTEKLLTASDVFTSAMAAAYREEQTRRLLREESERSALVDALLHGRLLEQWSLWEVADYLRLPNGGPYVVVAAETPAVGAEPLPGIESKLRSLDVFSAWRLLPDLQVGIVHVNSDKHREDVLALLSRISEQRVGVSARFDDLRDTAQALRDARVAIRGRPDPGVLVSAFDGSILATAAVSAPEVMTKLVAPTLDSFAEMADDERDVLFETFRVWVENDGSLRSTGELLFCHPNTVRYRLHRIEQRTGRSLSRPRDLAEICLALEVHRRLM
jgi:PucR C-terminal helix-turn-helix domain/GGDEF-like domain